MILVSQNQQTRKWGFKIMESIQSENKYDGVIRSLYEEYKCDSPQDVFAFSTLLKRALDSGSYKVGRDRDAGIYGYVVYNETGQVIMGEGGFQEPDQVNSHLNRIKSNVDGQIKMAPIPVSKTMAITKGTQAPIIKSTYEGKEYGGDSISIELDKIKEEEKLDRSVEKNKLGINDNDVEW